MRMKMQKSWVARLRPKLHKRSTLIAFAIFALTAALLLHQSLLPGYTLLPLDIIQDIKPWDHFDLGPRANRLLIDPFFIFYPNRALQTAAIQNGQLMLWNPYLFTGTPVIADPNFQPFYLPNLLISTILPVHVALPWLAWIHLTLTGLFMYLFLRLKEIHWFSAVLGGGVWLLNGYLLVWLENPHRLSTAAWFPAIFWAFEIANRKSERRWAALAGLFLGLAILGGQIQFIFFFGLIFAIYALINSYYRFQDRQKRRGEPLLNFALISLIGLSIGALIIVPSAEFSSFSQRTVFDATTVLETGWPAQQLITLIAPDFYGNPAGPISYWGTINYAEVTAYFGIVSLLLAISGIFVARKSRFLRTTLILLIIIFLIAFGTPFVYTLTLAPGFEFLALRRSLIFVPFLGSWLTALGLDGWMRVDLSLRRKLIALVISLFIILTTSILTVSYLGQSFLDHRETALQTIWRASLYLIIAIPLIFSLNRRPIVIASFLLLLSFAELLQWGYKFNPIISVDYLYPENAVSNFLKQDDTHYRVLPLQADKAVFGPNVLSVFDIETITGYSSLIKGDYAALLKGMDDEIEIGWMRGNENMLVMSHYHPLVGMLNVKYVLSAIELQGIPGLIPLGQFDGVWIYENADAAPRAFLVTDVQVTPIENMLSNLLSSDFDWRNSAMISESPLPDQENQMISGSENIVGTVEITGYEPGEVVLNVNTAEAAFLVLADAYYPGWQASLDSQLIPIYQTNLVLRGVFVPAGEHEIIFQFKPMTLKIGLGLSLFGISIALIIIVFDLRRNNYGASTSRIN